MATTKNDLSQKIAEKTGLQHIDVKKIVQKTLDGIIDGLVENGRFELRNFGIFSVAKRRARNARNPRTGEKCVVDACNVVRFKAGKTLEDKINNG